MRAIPSQEEKDQAHKWLDDVYEKGGIIFLSVDNGAKMSSHFYADEKLDPSYVTHLLHEAITHYLDVVAESQKNHE